MKNMKKLTALILAVCMLVGMPLSIDVAATGERTDKGFRLVQAMMIPEHWKNTSLDRDTQLALYFTGDVTKISSNVKAYIGIFNLNSWTYDGSIRHYTLSGRDTFDRISFGGSLTKVDDAALGGENNWENKSNPNKWVFTMDKNTLNHRNKVNNIAPDYQSAIEGDELDTIPELFKLAQMVNKRLMLVLVDSGSTGDGNVLEGVTGLAGDDGTNKTYTANLKADYQKVNPNHGNGNGNTSNNTACDGAHAYVYDETTAARMVGAFLDKNTKTLTVRFSEPVSMRNQPFATAGVTVLNKDNEVMGFSGTTNDFSTDLKTHGAQYNVNEVFTFSIENGASETVISLPDDRIAQLELWIQRVENHNRKNPDDELRVVYFVGENSAGKTTFSWRGEGKKNYYMDAIWTADGRPVMANTNTLADAGTKDTMFADVELVTVTVETLNANANDGSEGLLIEVPAAADFTGTKQIGVYQGDALVKIGTEDALWNLVLRSDRGISGRYVATLSESFVCDTLSEITAMLAEKGIAYDRIDLVHTLPDKTERIPIANNGKKSLQVEDISLYTNAKGGRYVVISFSEDIDLDAFKAAGDASKAYLVMKEAGVNDFYSGLADGAHGVRLPKENMSYLGSSKNKIVCEFPTASWVATIEQKVAESNGKAELAVRIESGNVSGGTATVMGLDPVDVDGVGLIGNEFWNTGVRSWLALNTATELRMESVKQICKNQLVVTFSTAVNISTTQPWMGLRLVNEKDQLVWLSKNTDGTPFDNSAAGKGLDMQWRATGWSFVDDDVNSSNYHKQILVTFNENMDIAKLLDMDNIPVVNQNPGKYKIKFGIEEKADRVEYGNNRVFSITDANNKGNQLIATTATSSVDGTYGTVTNLLTDSTQISVSDAKITGETIVTFNFSHAVNIKTGSKQGESVSAYFRYVNKNNILYGNETDGYMMVKTTLNYTDDTHMTMTAALGRSNFYGVKDFNDLLNPTGELKEFMDANPGRWVLVLEEKTNGNKGQIDTFAGIDGHVIEATKLIPNWADGLYLEITGKPIVGELTATKCEIVGDNQVLVTFSAPVAIAKKPDGTDAPPYVTMRLYNANSALLFWNPVTEEYIAREAMYDKDGKRVYKDLAGNYTTESEGKNENGEVVAYKAQSNTPMQWATTWEWGNKEHTKILYTFKGVKDMPANNLPDMLAYDWNQIQEGAFLGFDFEEKYDGVKIDNDNHVQNIFRADNPKICLDATFFPHNLDSVMWKLKEGMVWSYKPQNITAKAEVISDTQIRIAFSQAIDMEYVPFMGIRMVDKEGNLMWNGEPNLSSPYQWTGSWEWEDDSHRAIIWSMTGNGMLGGNTLYNLANWAGVLQKYKDEGNWKFCIEEKNRDGFYTIAYNGLIENIAAKGTNSHMRGNYGAGTSGVYMNLDMSELVGGAVTLISAKATDDQTIALTFSKPVVIDEGISMGVRYLTPSGDSEVLADGRTAYFKGTWEYADETKTVITWKLNSKHAKNLTDIIQFNGNFEWNKGARVAFVIMDEEGDRLPLNTLRINGVRDITELQHLTGNYKTKECVMSQLDIEVLYDLPSNAVVKEAIQYITNYLPFVLILSATSVCGLVVAVALGVKRKKSR